MENENAVSFKRAIELLADPSSTVQNSLTSILADFDKNTGALFFECYPISLANWDTTPFSFVLLPAPRLATVSPDSSPFEEQFSKRVADETVATFYNLGKDALLVSPAAVASDLTYYTHLQSFARYAPREQVQELWIRVAQAVVRRLSELRPDQKLWLSTSGLGVYWLHIRLDTVPKYYNWMPYKNA
jgi:hypothetical protein